MPFSLRLVLIIVLCMRTSAQFLVDSVRQFVVNSYWLFDLHQWFVHYFTLKMRCDAVLCSVLGYIVWTVIQPWRVTVAYKIYNKQIKYCKKKERNKIKTRQKHCYGTHSVVGCQLRGGLSSLFAIGNAKRQFNHQI